MIWLESQMALTQIRLQMVLVGPISSFLPCLGDNGYGSRGWSWTGFWGFLVGATVVLSICSNCSNFLFILILLQPPILKLSIKATTKAKTPKASAKAILMIMLVIILPAASGFLAIPLKPFETYQVKNLTFG